LDKFSPANNVNRIHHLLGISLLHFSYNDCSYTKEAKIKGTRLSFALSYSSITTLLKCVNTIFHGSCILKVLSSPSPYVLVLLISLSTHELDSLWFVVTYARKYIPRWWLVNHIIQLEKDIAEDVNATLSLTKNFVHAVECS
jgi:hypothetical protein